MVAGLCCIPDSFALSIALVSHQCHTTKTKPGHRDLNGLSPSCGAKRGLQYTTARDSLRNSACCFSNAPGGRGGTTGATPASRRNSSSGSEPPSESGNSCFCPVELFFNKPRPTAISSPSLAAGCPTTKQKKEGDTTSQESPTTERNLLRLHLCLVLPIETRRRRMMQARGNNSDEGQADNDDNGGTPAAPAAGGVVSFREGRRSGSSIEQYAAAGLRIATTAAEGDLAQREQRILPSTFTPSELDVICGRDHESYSHVGNQRLRSIIKESLEAYEKAGSKRAKSEYVAEIVDSIRCGNTNGGFVRNDYDLGRWVEIGDARAREKVGHAIRIELRKRNKKKNLKGGGDDDQETTTSASCPSSSSSSRPRQKDGHESSGQGGNQHTNDYVQNSRKESLMGGAKQASSFLPPPLPRTLTSGGIMPDTWWGDHSASVVYEAGAVVPPQHSEATVGGISDTVMALFQNKNAAMGGLVDFDRPQQQTLQGANFLDSTSPIFGGAQGDLFRNSLRDLLPFSWRPVEETKTTLENTGIDQVVAPAALSNVYQHVDNALLLSPRMLPLPDHVTVLEASRQLKEEERRGRSL